MARVRPVFQRQGPARNCVIDKVELGWESCTAYSMAMLIDVATDGALRPKGCKIRRAVEPRDLEGGLSVRQVAEVADKLFNIQVTNRTGRQAISVEKATRQILKGRGFLLQGNNVAFRNKGNGQHAIWVNEVRKRKDGTLGKALVYDPQRTKPVWMPWRKVLAFGAALFVDQAKTRRLGPDKLYAAFPPPRPTKKQVAALPPPVVEDGVKLRFGAVKTKPFPDKTVANPPAGRRVNVRSQPGRFREEDIVTTLGEGDRFEAFQRVTLGEPPPGSTSRDWLGNKDGTLWVHVSGLKRVGGTS